MQTFFNAKDLGDLTAALAEAQEVKRRYDLVENFRAKSVVVSGVAYDIDMSRAPEVAGTIAGADTVFVLLREGVSREESNEFFARFIPSDLIE